MRINYKLPDSTYWSIVFKAYCKNHTKKRQMMQRNFDANEANVGVDEEEEGAGGEEEHHEEKNEVENTRYIKLINSDSSPF